MGALLGLQGKEEAMAIRLLPVGRAFSGGSRCDTVPAQNSERPVCEEEERPLGGAFMGGVTSFIGSVRWWVAAYKYPVASPPFSLLPSVAILALASSPS